MVLLGIIIPFLVFFISMNTTYAYFTATASKQESSTNTATIRINFSDVGYSATNTNNAIVSSSKTTSVRNILPGDTLKVNGSIITLGSASCYLIFEIEVAREDANIAVNSGEQS